MKIMMDGPFGVLYFQVHVCFFGKDIQFLTVFLEALITSSILGNQYNNVIENP